MNNKVYPLFNRNTHQIVWFTMDQILHLINDDRSDEWTSYDESDWEEGINEWTEWTPVDVVSLILHPELNNPPTERKPPMKDSTPNATVVPNDEFSKLVTKAYKYDRLVAVLKEHLDDPDDVVMVKDLGLRAESDEKLDELMDAGGFDSYDEMLEEIEAWKNRG